MSKPTLFLVFSYFTKFNHCDAWIKIIRCCTYRIHLDIKLFVFQLMSLMNSKSTISSPVKLKDGTSQEVDLGKYYIENGRMLITGANGEKLLLTKL